MKGVFTKHKLQFIHPAITSRGTLHSKEIYLLEISEKERKGIGECSLFRGLGCDDRPDYENKLQWLCENINNPEDELINDLREFPSIIFGYEQALLNLRYGGSIYFPSKFTEGKESIKINGLIWMGGADFVQKQIDDKISKKYSCIKIKIGKDWESEKKILEKLRDRLSKDCLEIRVDANGAFNFEQAKRILDDLQKLDIHSIEQPIKPKKFSEMQKLCSSSPIPIALDEELIGIMNFAEKAELIRSIKPQYIILKPSLMGGISGSKEWIKIAEGNKSGWWITSALESNIGLNALTQWTATLKNPMAQGLGTGGLYANNFQSNLLLQKDKLFYKPNI